jgi:FKBP-type peptidyl-prolyl cis-trans isomerase SlyD
MKVTKNKVVSLTYQLRVNNQQGEVIESLSNDAPLTFLYGSGGLLPKFEDNIDGLAVGDTFNFNIPSKDAYGEINNEAIVDVPIVAFEIDGKVDENMLSIGNQIPMQDSAGNKLNGTVKKIDNETVTMDFNHPLAGEHLFFTGEITDVRDATEDELHHGHAHYEGSCEGCEHCGGEGDHCGSEGGHC